ncbi:MAG: shikimate dehydrogenase, partial [Candidatus Bathyarchaeia archaeon]
GVDPSGKKIVILGAGGASRAVSFTLAREAKKCVILNRTLEKAENLVNDLSDFLGSGANLKAGNLNDANLKEELRDAEILINATMVGMRPKEDKTPVNPDYLNQNMVVFDLVYDPLETRLLREAKNAGARIIDGLSMLVHQGAASFEIWTGKKAPVNVMMEAARGKLMEKN